MSFRPFLLAAICALSAVSTSRADLITFTVQVTQDTVNAGGTVDWSLYVTVSDANASDNFGINVVSANLMDSFGETLSPGTIGAPFELYSDTHGGTFNGTTKVLVEIGAVLLKQNSSAQADISAGDSPGPLLLASGSYAAFTLGTHTLEAVAGSSNQYFTAAGQNTGAGNAFESTAFVSDTFNVVPEPSTMSLGILSAVISAFAIWRQRRRSAVRA